MDPLINNFDSINDQTEDNKPTKNNSEISEKKLLENLATTNAELKVSCTLYLTILFFLHFSWQML